MVAQHGEEARCIIVRLRKRPLIDAEHLLIELANEWVVSHLNFSRQFQGSVRLLASIQYSSGRCECCRSLP